MVLPMNSGAEAVETAVKAARKWGYEKKRIPKDRAEIIACADNFHGRTTTIVGFSTGALANNVSNTISVSGGTIYFGALHTDSDPFTDTFDFDNVLGSVLASASLITIGFTPAQNIDFTSATLNGNPLSLTPTGVVESAFTLAELGLTGPLQLVVTGTTGAGGGVFSSYSGTLNVTVIPEPGTYALMLAGLGGIGFMARRQNRS
jgi:hypothetical protein